MLSAAFTSNYFSFLLMLLPFSVAEYLSNVGLNTVQLIEKHGFLCETHYITTSDGYILTYHRIVNRLNGSREKDKPVALVMHGISSSSADSVNLPRNMSMGYLLADAGYDVWLANARGNAWSRSHITLHPLKNPEKFFDFSWHEIGYYDLPAAIDHILYVTKAKQLHYVGHSQGGTVFLVLAATRPEYNKKIRLATLMAPAAFLEHRKDIVIEIAPYIDELAELAKTLRWFEIPYTRLIRQLLKSVCGRNDEYSLFCRAYFNWMGGGEDNAQLEEELMPVIGSNVPSNAAMKQWIHFGQLVKNGGFNFFDYGASKNLKIYGSDRPPKYNLSKIICPVAVYYGENDGVVPLEDVKNLLSRLLNVVHQYLVPYAKFNHIDFAFARDVFDLVFKEVLSVMKKY